MKQMVTMRLFRRRENAEKKWHKKAIFVDPFKVKIVLETTGKLKKPKKPKRLQSWLVKNHSAEASFSSSPHITLRTIKKEACYERAWPSSCFSHLPSLACSHSSGRLAGSNEIFTLLLLDRKDSEKIQNTMVGLSQTIVKKQEEIVKLTTVLEQHNIQFQRMTTDSNERLTWLENRLKKKKKQPSPNFRLSIF